MPRTELGNEGAQAIGEAIPYNTTLQKLGYAALATWAGLPNSPGLSTAPALALPRRAGWPTT